MLAAHFARLSQQAKTKRRSTATEGPSIPRKIPRRSKVGSGGKDGSSGKKTPSLLANFANLPTPPNEFPKKLGLEATGNGKTLFPPCSADSKPCSSWTVDQGAFIANLENTAEIGINGADGHANNTLAIKFTAPSDSKRFSFNICPWDHNNFSEVLLHFNPRQFQTGGRLVLNSQEGGTWGQAINVPASTLPLIFGQVSCTLIVQIQSSGFDIFLDDKYIAHLTHRRPLFNNNEAAVDTTGTPPSSSTTSLVLNIPTTDDYKHPENWTVHKVWWGHKPPMVPSTSNRNTTSPPFSSSHSITPSTSPTDSSITPPPSDTTILAVKTLDLHHPRKLFVRGLAKLRSDREIEFRKVELERAFRKYGGPRGVKSVIAPKYKSFAFVEMEEASQAEWALREMKSKYSISRARFSRHEAHQERRRQKNQVAGTCL